MTEHQKPAHKPNPQLSPITEVSRNTAASLKFQQQNLPVSRTLIPISLKPNNDLTCI